MARFAPYVAVAILGVLASTLLAPPRAARADLAGIARDTGARTLGAARGYASVALWLRAGDAYRRGDLYETTATYHLIRELQPRNPAVYSYLAWNEAYNLAGQFPEPERRMEWVARGFATLRQGQKALPGDAGLRLDEWHFVLNRSIGQPLGVLETELPAWGRTDPAWAAVVELARERHSALGESDRRRLRWFLDEIGLQPLIFEAPDKPVAERTPLEDMQAKALESLTPAVLELLGLCNWCRYHLMTLILSEAQRIAYRPLALDLALLNSYLWAHRYLVGGHAEFVPRYRQGVASAFKAGIDNALRYGGEPAGAAFAAHVRENFADVPELLPE
ncbi:MAG: hypothetical protein HS108_13295 [Planctomycetes bacterium]|jgi:hypothetical protein|nr:hypothetical protein [Planctomycetota bacterium]MCL4730838.1 hypothetical protein [Planctomycetota bacterium]